MISSVQQLVEALRAGKSVGAVVLLGTDGYLRESCRNKILDAWIAEGAREWAVARLSAREEGWDAILGQARTQSMLAPRQVIVVDDVESFEDLGEERREKILKAIGEYLASSAPFTILVFEADALDRRQKLFKVLNESKQVQLLELTVSPESAPSLAMQMARDLGVELNRDAAALLAESVNGEPARMHIEIEKLATYAQSSEKRNRITAEDVQVLVTAARRNTVWQLADMLAGRDRGGAFRFLDNLLREGEDPAGMIGAIAWRYRGLIQARELPPHTPGYQAARALGMRPDAAEAAIRQAHRASKTDLLAGLRALAEADRRFKSRNPDPRATMEFLIAQLTSSEARSKS